MPAQKERIACSRARPNRTQFGCVWWCRRLDRGPCAWNVAKRAGLAQCGWIKSLTYEGGLFVTVSQMK